MQSEYAWKHQKQEFSHKHKSLFDSNNHWIEMINSHLKPKSTEKSLINISKRLVNCNKYTQKSDSPFSFENSDTVPLSAVYSSPSPSNDDFLNIISYNTKENITKRLSPERNYKHIKPINDNLRKPKGRRKLNRNLNLNKNTGGPTKVKIKSDIVNKIMLNRNMNASNSSDLLRPAEINENKNVNFTEKNILKSLTKERMNDDNKSWYGSFFKLDYVFGKFSKNVAKLKNIYGFERGFGEQRLTTSSAMNLSFENQTCSLTNQNMLFARFTSDQNITSTNDLPTNPNYALNKYSEELSFSPRDQGVNKKQPKSKFTKTMVRIVSSLGNYKKSKLVKTSVNILTENGCDNLVNLIAILSMERIILCLKNKENEQSELKKNGSSTAILTNRNSSKGNGSKISFDLNGRAIHNGSAIKSGSRFNRQSMGSLSAPRLLSSLKSKNISTYSIPSRYNGDSRSHKVAFNSTNREYLKVKANSMNKLSQQALNNSDEIQETCRRQARLADAPNPEQSSIKLEMNESGGYIIGIPIVSSLDFTKLNDIFSLKDDLYHRCEMSSIYVKPKYSKKTSNDCLNTNTTNDLWLLYIESPTKESLHKSIQYTANRFPEWNIKSNVHE